MPRCETFNPTPTTEIRWSIFFSRKSPGHHTPVFQASSTTEIRSSSKALSHAGGLGAEVAVAEVADARHDVELVIDTGVDGGGDYGDQGEGVGDVMHAWGKHALLKTSEKFREKKMKTYKFPSQNESM